jgi:hypothetical protein
VRDTVIETRDKKEDRFSAGTPTAGALKGDRHDQFGRQFSEAQKPSCFGPNALKHQPAEIRTKDWVIGAGGLLALPFWGAAILRGKCR